MESKCYFLGDLVVLVFLENFLRNTSAEVSGSISGHGLVLLPFFYLFFSFPTHEIISKCVFNWKFLVLTEVGSLLATRHYFGGVHKLVGDDVEIT